jgi:DNA-binding HxlR family transcriptional regulator
MAGEATTHLKVPMEGEDRAVCLGPDGAVAHVTRTMRMIRGRWKLPILFLLYADPSMRTSQLRRDLPVVSQKMLTRHLRELEEDHLIDRVDFCEKPLRVEYKLYERSRSLIPVLVAMRNSSANYLVSRGSLFRSAFERLLIGRLWLPWVGCCRFATTWQRLLLFIKRSIVTRLSGQFIWAPDGAVCLPATSATRRTRWDTQNMIRRLASAGRGAPDGSWVRNEP